MNDTIAAISTAFGTAAIGIVRISGEAAFEIAEKVFIGNKKIAVMRSHTAAFGKVIDFKTQEIIDEVLVLKLTAPNTFTRENTVEINCHGNLIVLKRVLEMVIKAGARLAEPGEFTKRAFINGRIDLAQAEAVIDLINSKTDQASKAALEQLEGKLSELIVSVRSELIEILAHIDVNIDYPEYDIEEISREEVYKRIYIIKDKLVGIIKNFERGRAIREGVGIVITGKPNVGKSSLLNELVGKNRAIVTDVPGTTRDVLEEYISIRGIPARITDTAGIRESSDEVEKIGIEKAKDATKMADLILIVVDAQKGIMQEELEYINQFQQKHLVILNKVDLADNDKIDDIISKINDKNIIKTSLKFGRGVEELEDEIANIVSSGEICSNTEVLVTNVRHKTLIDKAIDSLDDVLEGHQSEMPIDLIAIDIKNSADSLGKVVGQSVNEDVINEIFKRFCLGK